MNIITDNFSLGMVDSSILRTYNVKVAKIPAEILPKDLHSNIQYSIAAEVVSKLIGVNLDLTIVGEVKLKMGESIYIVHHADNMMEDRTVSFSKVTVEEVGADSIVFDRRSQDPRYNNKCRCHPGSPDHQYAGGEMYEALEFGTVHPHPTLVMRGGYIHHREPKFGLMGDGPSVLSPVSFMNKIGSKGVVAAVTPDIQLPILNEEEFEILMSPKGIYDRDPDSVGVPINKLLNKAFQRNMERRCSDSTYRLDHIGLNKDAGKVQLLPIPTKPSTVDITAKLAVFGAIDEIIIGGPEKYDI